MLYTVVFYICDTKTDLLIDSTEAIVFHQHDPMHKVLCVMGQRHGCGCFATPIITVGYSSPALHIYMLNIQIRIILVLLQHFLAHSSSQIIFPHFEDFPNHKHSAGRSIETTKLNYLRLTQGELNHHFCPVVCLS